jgi:hypothetical protein
VDGNVVSQVPLVARVAWGVCQINSISTIGIDVTMFRVGYKGRSEGSGIARREGKKKN